MAQRETAMVEMNEKVKGTPPRAKRFLIQALMGLAVASVGFVALLVAATTLPGLFGFTPVVVLSGSMEPSIRAGDIVVTRGVDPTTVGLGDVVTYRSGKLFVTHRIIRVEDTPQGREFEVKGDNNPTSDTKLVAEGQVVAKVVYDLPKMGYLINFANSFNGLTLLVIVPGVILGLMWHRERQEKKALPQASPMQQSDDKVGKE